MTPIDAIKICLGYAALTLSNGKNGKVGEATLSMSPEILDALKNLKVTDLQDVNILTYFTRNHPYYGGYSKRRRTPLKI